MVENIAKSSARERLTGGSEWRLAFAIVAGVLVLSYGFFFSGGGWNQATRFNLVRAIVESGTLTIDRYHENTGDKAFRDGHYYCDKAPGASLLAVPVAAVARPVLRWLGVSPKAETGLLVLAFLAAFVASSLPTVGAALALMALARERGATPVEAAIVAIAVALGSPIFAYAVLFWGHAGAGACLIGAMWLLASSSSDSRRRRTKEALAGLLLAWSVVMEYPAAGAAGLIGLSAVVNAWLEGRWKAVGRLVLYVGAGGLLPAGILLSYQAAAFGSPFTLGYSNVEGFEGMKEGLWGISLPRPGILLELLVGLRRGLLWLSPALILLAPLGLVLSNRTHPETKQRLWTYTAGAVAIYYLLLKAGYHYWDGGFSYGPRHLAPGLWFLALGLIPCLRAGRWLRRTTLGLVALGVAITLPVVAVNPMPPDYEKAPFVRHALPSLLKGDLGQNVEPYFRQDRATENFNVGELLGLPGALSLLPLLALWLVALWRFRSVRHASSS